jgi:hypothetical protein
MIKKFTLGILSLGLMASVHAANVASDNASTTNYPGGTWSAATNGGSGFGAWSFTASGGGGHFIGATGETDNPSFGLFAGGTGATDLSSADRSFTGGALTAGQTFSLDMGVSTAVSAGDVGINFLNGVTPEFTFKFTSGGSFWQLNDGGVDFNTTIPFSANTKINFAFTYNGGASYSLVITEGATTYTANAFTATNPITNLTGARFFSNQQGVNQNLGFNNLAVVPEPATVLLVGPALLAGMFFIRRRRA